MFNFQKSDAAYIYDAFFLIANTIDKHNLVDLIPEIPIASCANERPWMFGSDFIKYLKLSNFKGLSGHIEFDQTSGYRKNLKFSIVDKTKAGVDLVKNIFYACF